jgi:hypothetical protein
MIDSYADLHVERMLAEMQRLTADADERKARARAAFADGGTLAELVAAVLEAGDVALIIGSPAALESYRVPPAACRVLLDLVERGDVDIFEFPMGDDQLRVCSRPPDWLTWILPPTPDEPVPFARWMR